jgi:hypothetical protein
MLQKCSSHRDLSEYDINSSTTIMWGKIVGLQKTSKNSELVAEKNQTSTCVTPTTIYTKTIDLSEIYNNIYTKPPLIQFNIKKFELENRGFLTLRSRKVGEARG